MAKKMFSITIKPSQQSDCILRIWCDIGLALQLKESIPKIPGVLCVAPHISYSENDSPSKILPILVEIDLRYDINDISDDILRLVDELEGEN